ncbi:hypothetical protein IF2G_04788 [Cordyceps javanica]|nr:hypothetical protein IF2G_04788 [Cordyceps javanica]
MRRRQEEGGRREGGCVGEAAKEFADLRMVFRIVLSCGSWEIGFAGLQEIRDRRIIRQETEACDFLGMSTSELGLVPLRFPSRTVDVPPMFIEDALLFSGWFHPLQSPSQSLSLSRSLLLFPPLLANQAQTTRTARPRARQPEKSHICQSIALYCCKGITMLASVYHAGRRDKGDGCRRQGKASFLP